MKTNRKWILVILVFCQVTSGAGEEKTMKVKEEHQASVTCTLLPKASLVVWFRVLSTGVEFIASFSNQGMLKVAGPSFPSFFTNSMTPGIFTLHLKSFNKARDSGVYTCASLSGGVKLEFGEVTRLVGEPVEVEVAVDAPQPAVTAPSTCTTAAPCVCTGKEKNEQGETSPQVFCSPLILGPLAGGCGLLLLSLVISTLYCNHMRTRRCPHHYKKKRAAAPGKQMKTNRHV
ncbi:T-cell surface glycoprotein CD8 alpha chain [Clinocottus analis]|uniref:T-cell surface glycoprotein CD8 alpha chain n=1 Tax=Clinocottus analis TaxID=304258 RepID=UPI0035C1E390